MKSKQMPSLLDPFNTVQGEQLNAEIRPKVKSKPVRKPLDHRRVPMLDKDLFTQSTKAYGDDTPTNSAFAFLVNNGSMQSPLSTYRAIVLSKSHLMKEQAQAAAAAAAAANGGKNDINMNIKSGMNFSPINLTSLTPHADARAMAAMNGDHSIGSGKRSNSTGKQRNKGLVPPPWRYPSASEAKEMLKKGGNVDSHPVSHTCPYNAEVIIRHHWSVLDAMKQTNSAHFYPANPHEAKRLIHADYYLNGPDLSVKLAELKQIRHRSRIAKMQIKYPNLKQTHRSHNEDGLSETENQHDNAENEFEDNNGGGRHHHSSSAHDSNYSSNNGNGNHHGNHHHDNHANKG
jgi:hypothetical protein